MDYLTLVESMKEQGYSAKRALFNLKIRQGSLSSEMIDTVKSVYALSDEELRYLTGWFPQLKGKVSGKHTLILCRSCHKGDETAITELSNWIQTPIGGTSEDGLFSLEVTGCMGLCALGPNAILDQQIYTAIRTNTVFKNRIMAILDERKRG
jgi:NADH:ubiquinone oxidoreductase subunit E